MTDCISLWLNDLSLKDLFMRIDQSQSLILILNPYKIYIYVSGNIFGNLLHKQSYVSHEWFDKERIYISFFSISFIILWTQSARNFSYFVKFCDLVPNVPNSATLLMLSSYGYYLTDDRTVRMYSFTREMFIHII